MSSTRTQSQHCTATTISSFVQCQVSFRSLPSSVTTFVLIKFLKIVREILEEMQVILESDDRHEKVYPDIPVIGFKNNNNLARSQIAEIDEIGKFKSCGGKRSPCKSIKYTCRFKSKQLDEVYKINIDDKCKSQWLFI